MMTSHRFVRASASASTVAPAVAMIAVAAITFITSAAQAVTYRSNVPQATQDQMNRDLAFMGTLAGAKTTALHQQVFGPMATGNYATWFNARVKSVAYDANDTSGAVAYVAPYFDSSQMVLTSTFLQFDHPEIARMMVVYHEARHTEDAHGNWPHATCPTPFKDESGNDVTSIWTGLSLAGLDGCDDESIGAYGSSVVLLKNVNLNCDTCSEKVKMDAAIYADDQLKRVTNSRSHEALKQDLYAL